MNEQLDRVAEAFSRQAAVYDALGQGHENLARMRRQVRAHLTALVTPGSALLELNAGTGIDAAALARQGYRVHATDLAPGMVAAIEEKIARGETGARLTAQRCSFADLSAVTGGPFDGVFSNFGGLNCTRDLAAVARQLPHLLVPGGVVTWVIMPRICPWELLRAGRDWPAATRRLRSGGVTAVVAGVPFHVTYYSSRQVRRAFDHRFRLLRLEAVSLLAPPADQVTFGEQHPRLYRLLVRADHLVRGWPLLRGWGDFFILSMRYEG